MNAYDKMVRDEVAKKYGTQDDQYIARLARSYKTWARTVVAGKTPRNQKPSWNTPEENRIYTLAVIAELKRKNPTSATINMNQVPNEVTHDDLKLLASEYIIELYRVAHPYQIVFLF